MKRYLGFIISLLLAVAVHQAIAQETGWGMHKRMFAVPAPGKVTVDGQFTDWDLSGRIEMYVMAATKDTQSAKFAVMYDTEALYIGAEVRDPTPLMNRHAPEAEGDMAWDADACQFRLVLDPALGYPVTDSTWQNAGNDQLVHLLMWYYTDRQEPNLLVHRTMGYAPLPGAEKFGVMPKAGFQAAYRLMDDKRGYTFEYRIPWKTLGAKKAPTGGDLVAATLQIDWGRADGLKTAGIGGWGYDLMGFPGFAYQNAGCWGKLIFSKTGNLSPELVNEGLPPEKPLPLKFSYDLPEDGEVTIALVNEKKEVVRTLMAQSQRTAGQHTELWDGLDELSQPLPAGTYAWKGLYHGPITSKYVLSVHNSGQPAWKTDANDGGWGGDHGVPIAIANAGNDLVMSWNYAETGWGLIRTDGEGKKKWGALQITNYLASDGTRIFTAGFNGLRCFDAKDGRPMPYGNGAATLDPPPGATGDCGLACQGGKLYVSFSAGNKIGIYDPVQGTLQGSWDVPAPGCLAARPGGGLLGISAGKLVAIQDGKVTPLADTHLDNPWGVAVDAVGTIYVSNRGKLQNVSVFASDGKYLKSIGKEGGRPLIGRYDPAGMQEPAGLAIDAKGRLWVMECIDAPKRVSVWDPKTGGMVKEFFGGAHYSANMWMDPERPDEVYCDGVMWKVDLDKKTSYPYSTVWRPRDPNSPGMFGTHHGGLVMFTAKNGKQYGFAIDSSYSSVLLMRDGDIFKPLLAFIWTKSQPAVAAKYPTDNAGATLAWVDKNNDQIIQTEEIGSELGKSWFRGFSWVDGDLNLWHASGKVFRPLRIEADGHPVYDFTKPDTVAASPSAVDPDDGAIYTLQPGKLPGKDIGYSRKAPDGTLQWGYRGVIEWPSALSLPPQRPGKLWGPTTTLGTAGEFTGVNTYFGIFHLFTRQDGLYVAKVFRDPRMGGDLGPDIISCENGNGRLVKPKGMNRYFALGGDQDGRVTEVFGLDTVKRLPGGTLTISEQDARLVAEAQAEYQAKLARGQRLAIGRGTKSLTVAQPVSKTRGEQQAFEVKAAYDEKNLYLAYTVTTQAELVNGITDPKLLFKGGNCLDIQLAADPAADAKRTTPAVGDVRLLITRQNGKPFAVIYRPKVKGYQGEPAWTLTSPTGKETFDAIEVTDQIELAYKKSQGINAFSADVTIPLELLGWTPRPGTKVRMDVGFIFGNSTGVKALARSYWANNGFSANVLDDVPNESRLTPNEWGEAEVE